MVGWLAGIECGLGAGEGGQVLSSMCHVVRRTLGLPMETPRAFLCAEKSPGLPVPNNALRVHIIRELTRAANSRHPYVERTTQHLLRLMQHGVTNLGEMDTDYTRLAKWCESIWWQPHIHEERTAGDQWACTLEPLEVDTPRLVLIVDVSGYGDE